MIIPLCVAGSSHVMIAVVDVILAAVMLTVGEGAVTMNN